MHGVQDIESELKIARWSMLLSVGRLDRLKVWCRFLMPLHVTLQHFWRVLHRHSPPLELPAWQVNGLEWPLLQQFWGLRIQRLHWKCVLGQESKQSCRNAWERKADYLDCNGHSGSFLHDRVSDKLQASWLVRNWMLPKAQKNLSRGKTLLRYEQTRLRSPYE